MIIFIIIAIVQSTLLSADEIEIKEYILQNLNCPTLELVIMRGFGDTVLTMIDEKQILSHDLLVCSQQYFNNEMQRWNSIRRDLLDERMIDINPVIQWAQSKEKLWIKVKFAHRVDAPAYINVGNHQISLDKDNLGIFADCIEKHVRFIDNLQLLESCNNLEYKLESAGTMVITIVKDEKKLWLTLTKDAQKYLIWWDMKKQIGSDMDEFSRMLEQEQEKPKPKKAKKVKPQQKGLVDKVFDWFGG